jgi:branched-chain amino acid transport system permease protein
VKSLWTSLGPLAVGVALLFGLDLVANRVLGAYVSKVMLDIGVNVIAAVSLNLVNGFTGQFSIGHAGFMAVGAYIASCITHYGLVSQGMSLTPPDPYGVPIFAGALVAGGLGAAGFGYVVGLPSLRLRGDYLAIVTLGFGEIIRVFVQNTGPQLSAVEVKASSPVGWFGHLGGALGFSNVPQYTTFFWVYAFVLLTILVSMRLLHSTHGRAFLSVRENEVAAEAVGIDTTRYKVRAFVIGAFFAGVAGGLGSHVIGGIDPKDYGFMRSFEIVIMVVLGGMGSISGAVMAAVLLTFLPEGLRAVQSTFGGGDYRMVLYSVALIVLMLVRPKGLFGTEEIWTIVARWRRR